MRCLVNYRLNSAPFRSTTRQSPSHFAPSTKRLLPPLTFTISFLAVVVVSCSPTAAVAAHHERFSLVHTSFRSPSRSPQPTRSTTPPQPPRYHSSDAVPQIKREVPPPRSHSPSPSVSSNRSSRKPVPAYDPDAPGLPSPSAQTSTSTTSTTAPRPTNPNPFAIASGTHSAPATGRSSPSPTSISPTDDSAPGSDDFGILNFGRRPSAIDPLAPSFASTGSHGHPASRQLVGGLPSPTRASNQATAAAAAQHAARPAPPPLPSPSSHTRRQSHSRQPSISLPLPSSSPSSSPLPSPTSQPSGKILPLQPVPTRTRAPMEAFASVEMLQGQREHADRTRGSEVFGRDGKYEGRASLSGASGEGAHHYSRRQDPTENVRAARGSSRMAGGAPSLPPIEVDVASIATQLREHDAGRRDSEGRRESIWRRSFSGDEEPDSADFTPTKNFSFPPNRASSIQSTVTATTSSPESDLGDPSDLGPYSDKSLYADAYSSKERLAPGAGGWRTEYLGSSEKAFQMQRPSIVALPVYPSPSGTLGRSWKLKARKVAVKLTWVTVVVSNASTWWYLSLRYSAMREVDGKIPGVFVGGWAFLVLETLVAIIMTLTSLWSTFSYRTSGADPKMRLRGDANLPAVDVFVVSSGQSDQTTFDCAVAAASMDYPPHRYRVMVLDPTGSLNLQRDINKHAKSQACPHLSYHRRALGATQGDMFHTKANSINFGMMEANSFGVKGPAEFIAVFDADMIPERNYLRAMLPSILGEGKVGLVKTTQGFINLPQRLSQAVSTLMTAAETPSDSRSGFLLRRAALVEIGGFPSDSWIQDGQCEALLQGRGYKIAEVDEVLQWSMAKPTYGSQIHSMMVNRLGPLRTAARLGFFFFGGNEVKMVPFWSRIKGVGRAILPILSVLALLFSAVYPFMFSFGGILVLTPNLDNLNLLLKSALIMLLLNRLHEFLWSWSTGQPSPRRIFQSWIFASPYQGVALIRMILPVWLGGYARGSDIDINAVSAQVRPSFAKRLGWLLIDPHTNIGASFLASVGVAIWRVVKDYEHGTLTAYRPTVTVLLTFGWPSMLWIDFVFASIVPFTCLLFPSRLLTEPRESFLVRDHYTSVARPKQPYKTAMPFRVHRGPEFLVGFLLVGWAIACVVVGEFTDVLA
ncbi:hypothetical protein BCR35DRAFT_316900 [Leucosporidium creatinivorum]|uniref:Glycosyltransferase 2-like domain-containing protein n=1 Tax=Leucosporidium creatinivorum TaxID=106004 RepID=A0A1Y2G344_9BASI|nr:hypothetical protein BCR35DRAFT_316900 [Leucosporidium creatinivorum]